MRRPGERAQQRLAGPAQEKGLTVGVNPTTSRSRRGRAQTLRKGRCAARRLFGAKTPDNRATGTKVSPNLSFQNRAFAAVSFKTRFTLLTTELESLASTATWRPSLRVRLRMSGMADSSDEEISHGEEDHGFGDVDASFVVADEATVSGQPADAAFDYPAARDHLESWIAVGAAHDLDDEIEEGCLIEQFAAVVGSVGEEVLDPGPALADGNPGLAWLRRCRRCPPRSG